MFESSNIIFAFSFLWIIELLPVYIADYCLSEKGNPFTSGDLTVLPGKSFSSSWLLRPLQSKADTKFHHTRE